MTSSVINEYAPENPMAPPATSFTKPVQIESQKATGSRGQHNRARCPHSFTPALCLLLLCTACRDNAAEALARAQYAHRALLADSARPHDARFDEVLSQLDAIPKDSPHAADANRLRRVIEDGRRHIRTPLALGETGHRSPELEAQLAACRALAELAGRDGGVDRAAMFALEDCRRKAEVLELKHAHGDDHEEPP